MDQKQFDRIHTGKGFIAALDQSGGSTPKALLQYGIDTNKYHSDEEMFYLVHLMRTRIIKSPAFNSDSILGAILFENTLYRTIDDEPTADYLWNQKGVVPFLKVDQGLAGPENGVQLMKPITGLDNLLEQATQKHVFGTKMRSVILEANPQGIKAIVAQQFEVGKQIFAAGLIPILEPEVNIQSADKEASEALLKQEILDHLAVLDPQVKVMLKLSIPTRDDFYKDLMENEHVVRVVALSGGYSQKEANERLARNHGLIASFSRALSQGLTAWQTDAEFNRALADSIQAIYNASIT
ncbi:fructose bisphosphate aldolase [Ethanoligenens harbinense]|uniref:fructose-bisphosphate aldolase n=1 Tax=Ethanoligenens harbinense (strain DSM 18485 / JCM 12961 / CGMCC 1.5033 / YUAN-3) TaxID=663278 RepID=E6U2K8_ETHHY|nr:fructose bisphosphate aldolase [Ethanoligenens harbinense]ADU26299.1 fructose-bisphosphate aldolase class-I [Ethanoligenens harbinense YUAN-3]AVQ95433.1 fructose bisphosphate aldolase [Ethanoligenens harbinense YUAN-3]AYF38098.1 fructose bisphosphate aldolase [Ethanoligenens harbinense]AYF40843.1 fructose bisphosphate aldolase [Ethanoligenens harbinense]QCN91673.1 fructose bisphosphate aldolase [Ethanoligenens harbinense]